MLAQLLEWHRREEKVDWWEFFRLNDMAADELLDERAGVAGLRFERRLEVTKRGVVVDRYSFPPQDTEFDGSKTTPTSRAARSLRRSRRSRRSMSRSARWTCARGWLAQSTIRGLCSSMTK